MPKNAKTKRPAPKKKSAPAAKAKRKAAPKAKPRAKAAAPAPAKGSFMWRLLEKKQAEIKRREQAQKDRGYGETVSHLHDVGAVLRFNGPRRKAA